MGPHPIADRRGREATTDAVITGFYLSKSSQNQNTWRTINVNISAALGKKFYIELFLGNPSGGGNNDGKGWAMDNIVIDQEPVVENCTDGVDNDGDGKADCEDPACISKGGCVELCGNGVDDESTPAPSWPSPPAPRHKTAPAAVTATVWPASLFAAPPAATRPAAS